MPDTLPQKRYSPFELILVYVFCLMLTNGFVQRIIAPDPTDESSTLLRLMWLPLYAFALAGCLWHIRALIATSLKMPFLIALIVLAVLSFAWAADPGVAQRRGIGVAMTCAMAIFLGIRYNWRTLLRVLGCVWLTIGFSALVSAIVFPSLGVMSEIHVGAWQGLYPEKNALGGEMARASFLFCILAIMDRKYRYVWLFGIVFTAFLVLMSTSKTSLVGLMAGWGIIGLAWWMRQGLIIGLVTLWFGLIIGGGSAALLVFAPEVVFEAIGREPTLTGRTDIWAVLMEAISEKPWLGYGYGVFWAPDSDTLLWVRSQLQWPVPTAHNSWLEVTLGVGLIGLACYVGNFIVSFIRALIAAKDTWIGVFALGVFAQFTIFSISESIGFMQNSMVWVTYVMVSVKLAHKPSNFRECTPVSPMGGPQQYSAFPQPSPQGRAFAYRPV